MSLAFGRGPGSEGVQRMRNETAEAQNNQNATIASNTDDSRNRAINDRPFCKVKKMLSNGQNS
jgi:hypothetical protein